MWMRLFLLMMATMAGAVETVLNVDTAQPKALLAYQTYDQGAAYDYRVNVKTTGMRATVTAQEVCVIQYATNATALPWAIFRSTSVNTNTGSFLIPIDPLVGPLGDGIYQVYVYNTNTPSRKYGLGGGAFRIEETTGYGAPTAAYYTVPLNTDLIEQTGSNVFARMSDVSGSGGGITNVPPLDYTIITNPPWAMASTVDATNALFSAWFSGLQSRTSYWDTAYSWGDWSVAVGANTAAIRILETNTVTRAGTNGWETGSHASFLTSAPPQSVVSVNGQTGAVVITAAGIGALTNETDLAALRLYHYGSPDIVESPEAWFGFDGAGTITGFNWEAGRTNVVIPWAIGGVDVVTVGASAFSGYGVTSIIGPKTSITVGDSAFNFCISLESVSLPSATTFGISAFSYCHSLQSVSLPSATTFSVYAFEFCGSLLSVTYGGNAPTYTAPIYDNTPNVTNYVTNPSATGWGATFGGRPVVRLPLYADAIYQAGELVATTNLVTDAQLTNYWAEIKREANPLPQYQLKSSVETKTDDYTVAVTDNGKTLVMHSEQNKTFSLPSVGVGDIGLSFTFIKTGLGKLTIDANDTDTIEDSGSGDGIYNSQGANYATLKLILISESSWRIESFVGLWTTTE